jgi:hypothetical protein
LKPISIDAQMLDSIAEVICVIPLFLRRLKICIIEDKTRNLKPEENSENHHFQKLHSIIVCLMITVGGASNGLSAIPNQTSR